MIFQGKSRDSQEGGIRRNKIKIIKDNMKQ